MNQKPYQLWAHNQERIRGYVSRTRKLLAVGVTLGSALSQPLLCRPTPSVPSSALYSARSRRRCRSCRSGTSAVAAVVTVAPATLAVAAVVTVVTPKALRHSVVAVATESAAVAPSSLCSPVATVALATVWCSRCSVVAPSSLRRCSVVTPATVWYSRRRPCCCRRRSFAPAAAVDPKRTPHAREPRPSWNFNSNPTRTCLQHTNRYLVSSPCVPLTRRRDSNLTRLEPEADKPLRPPSNTP
mmetsp:Transcript_48645/g.58890  ORF Transcript_48645/g.58890 Transcript_48645/m.58890 type:complete len:242 (-) Transcript_48645:236-961(-)